MKGSTGEEESGYCGAEVESSRKQRLSKIITKTSFAVGVPHTASVSWKVRIPFCFVCCVWMSHAKTQWCGKITLQSFENAKPCFIP